MYRPYQSTQTRYRKLQEDARRATAASMSAALGVPVVLTAWTTRALEAVERDWQTRRALWDWPEIVRRYQAAKTFTIAVWSASGDLIGLVLATMTRVALTIRYVEAAFNRPPAFQSKILLIALDACANYAQAAGISELRGYPTNAALTAMYENTYGFKLVSPPGEAPYHSRRV